MATWKNVQLPKTVPAFALCAPGDARALFEKRTHIDPLRALPVTANAWLQLHNGTLTSAVGSASDEPWWLDSYTGMEGAAQPDSDATVGTALFYTPPDLPCFAGHFPGQPLLPGVLQLHWAVRLAEHFWPRQLACTKFAGLSRVKFKAPIEPGAVLEVQLNRSAADASVKVTFKSVSETLTSARLIYRE